jgi:mannitol-1-phosphate 5-dehydrogenase
MAKKAFVGFGFGAIQGGLMLYEAFRSGNFDRLVVAEVVPDVVESLRRSRGRYSVNVATRTRLEPHPVEGVDVLNPTVAADREKLIAVIAEAHELSTALPSVDFFDKGDNSVAAILAAGLVRKIRDKNLPHCVLYACENNNHAAELLEAAIRTKLGQFDASALSNVFQCLNTVIGKMSKVVTDATEIEQENLEPVTANSKRAFQVEEFNRILITKITLPGFKRGITVFEEKADLLPFEEAKLYGHNAVHALIGYLANRKGYKFMSEVGGDKELLQFAREAFLEESGKALIHKRAGTDPLFTPKGIQAYAEDLLERMVNPYLRDAVDRVIRDPRRKLGWDDRLIGTMRLALDAGVTPTRFAKGAAAALKLLAQESPGKTKEQLLDDLWPDAAKSQAGRKSEITQLILQFSARIE